MKTKTKEVIFMIIWIAVYITAMQFFRFKFGIFAISAVWVLVGIPLFWLFKRFNKPKSN
jgi:ABC-type protease/lipase transport system fused ATPase/permease subunit